MASDDDDLLLLSAGAQDGAAPAPTDDPAWLVASADVANAFGAKFGGRPDLPMLIGAASAGVENHCNRTFALASLAESYDGGGALIFLRRLPVSAVDAVTVDGIPLDNSAGLAWHLEPDAGELGRGPSFRSTALGYPCAAGWGAYRQTGRRFSGPPWPAGVRNVLVQYTGGFAAIPRPVQQATLVVVKHLADATKNTGVYTDERLGDYEYQMAQVVDARLPFAARMLLGPYCLPRVG